MKALLKPHEVPLIPSTLKMLLTSALERVEEYLPDWEWVIANLEEAHDLALVAYEHAQSKEK